MAETTASVLELIKLLSHTIQASIVTEDGAHVFSILREDGLVGASSDLMLKNGIMVPGEWHMLGVVDALPDSSAFDFSTEAAALAIATGPFATLLNEFAPMLRTMGRPFDAHGMTPLLIFREAVPGGSG